MQDFATLITWSNHLERSQMAAQFDIGIEG